mgnify:CR=1 FL=1
MNLSIKNVPEELVERLRSRAKQNHRSMQGELMAIIDGALNGSPRNGPQPRRYLTAHDVYEMGKAQGLSTGDDSVRMIREDRDAR